MLAQHAGKGKMFYPVLTILAFIIFIFPVTAFGNNSPVNLIKLTTVDVLERPSHLKLVLNFKGRPFVKNINSGKSSILVYDFYPAVFPEIRRESMVLLPFISKVVVAQNSNDTVRIAVHTNGADLKLATALLQGPTKDSTVYSLDFSIQPGSFVRGNTLFATGSDDYLNGSTVKKGPAKLKSRSKTADGSVLLENTRELRGKDSFLAALEESLQAIKKSNRMIEAKKQETIIADSLPSSTLPSVTGDREEHKGRVWTVVLDPGHGGKDPGASGKKLHEKDIVLATAFEIARELNRIPFIKVVMTRTGDKFIKLRDRSAIAAKYKADLFVSLHCNSSPKAKSTGFEVYTLSRDGASDKVAHEVAQKENSVLHLEDNGAEMESTPMLNQILCSMMMTDTLNQSVLLAGFVGKEAQKMDHLLYRGHKNANFYVLRLLEIPAVLVEMGFVSNDKEERLMSTRRWQKLMAQKIAGGIRNYLGYVMMREGEFEDTPVCDYYVKRGDTLGRIARKYRTTVSNIVRLNSIADGSTIKAGQTIKVPGDPVASLLWETSQ